MLLRSRLKEYSEKYFAYTEKGSFSLTTSYIFKIFSNKFTLFRATFTAHDIRFCHLIDSKENNAVWKLIYKARLYWPFVLQGVGDLLVIARFIRDLQAEAGPFIFDIFCVHPKIAQWIFSNVPGFENSEFDTVMHIGKLRAFTMPNYT